jgi:ABC-type multidrug transport system permease subunit
MRFETKLFLAGVFPVVLIIGLVGVHSWYRGDWRPFAIVVAFYAAIYTACVVLARLDKWRRRRRRLRKRGERA